MGLAFLKKGKAAYEETEKAEAEREARAAQREQSDLYKRRFYMGYGEEKEVTFLSGTTTEDGMLDLMCFWEHHVALNGKWGNFFHCVSDEDTSCPICEEGDNPSLVYPFWVIDHVGNVSKGGKNKGKLFGKDEMTLFMAKSQTIDLLQRRSLKHDGLVGCRMSIARSKDDTSPRVGNDFEVIEKGDLKEIMEQYEIAEIPDFETIIPSYTAADLRGLGFGNKAETDGEFNEELD